MSDVFGSLYADAYDLLYHDKDYAAECDLIGRVFQTYGQDFPIRSVLDLGCGTGNHALQLATRGYEVVGVDQSEGMLARAESKAASLSAGGSVTFHQEDIRTVDLRQHFDAVLMMFAVFGYQLENIDLLRVLNVARRHLRTGGLLIFDVWYGPAVLHQRPSEQVKIIPTPDGKILRLASGELDIRSQVCTVHYRLWRLAEDLLVSETEESHTVRYFFSRELDLLLDYSGFDPVHLSGFPQFNREADETTWNVVVVGRATETVMEDCFE